MWFLAALALATLVPEGRALFEQNRFSEARAVLEKAVRSQPEDRAARFWLGYTHVALGDFEAAIIQFERVESAYANDPEFLFAAAEAYTRAARRLSEALSGLDDTSARRHQHLAARHLAAGDQPNALMELQAAIKCKPDLAGLYEQAAEIHWAQKNYEDAARALRAELEINPKSFIANLRYGQYLLQNHKAAEAVPNLRTAVRYHRYPEAHQLLAYALNQLDKTAEAQAVIQSGLEVFPNDPGLMEMRKPDPTPANYSEGSPLRESTPMPAHIRTLRQTDERLFWLNKIYTERAAQLFDRLEQIAPDSVRDIQAKGLNAEYAEDYATAEAYYRQALLKAPQIVGLHFSLGHVLRMEGKDDEAEAELRRDFQNHLTYYERGLIRNKKGEYAEAVRLLQNAVQLQPSFTAAQTELAKAYLQTAQPAKAVPLLESVLTRQSNHPTAHFLLSRAFRNLNQPDLAERELDLHRKLLQQERSTARVRHEQKDPPR